MYLVYISRTKHNSIMTRIFYYQILWLPQSIIELSHHPLLPVQLLTTPQNHHLPIVLQLNALTVGFGCSSNINFFIIIFKNTKVVAVHLNHCYVFQIKHVIFSSWYLRIHYFTTHSGQRCIFPFQKPIADNSSLTIENNFNQQIND